MLSKREMFFDLGSANDVNVQEIGEKLMNFSLNRGLRQRLNRNLATLVDGLGVYRVMDTLSESAARGNGRDCTTRH